MHAGWLAVFRGKMLLTGWFMVSGDFSPCSQYFCTAVQSSLTIPVNSRSAVILLTLLVVNFPQTIAEQVSSL